MGRPPLVIEEFSHARDILASYLQTYIREEIREEGLVRKLEPYLRFPDSAARPGHNWKDDWPFEFSRRTPCLSQCPSRCTT